MNISIIIKSHCSHRFPLFSLAIHPYHPSLLVALPDYILSLYKAFVSRFLLICET